MPSGPASRSNGRDRLLDALAGTWCVACVVALVLLIGIRWLHYSRWGAAPGLAGLLGEAMVFDSQAFLWPWVTTEAELQPLLWALAVMIVGFHRRLPGLIIRRTDGLWRFTRLGLVLLLTGMLWLNYVLDLNPTIAIACAAGLVLTVVIGRRTSDVLWSLLQVAIAGTFVAFARDPIDRITIVVWAIVLLATQRWLAPRMARLDVLLVRTATVLPVSLLSITLPLFIPLHGGTWLGNGLAYDFCEVPGHGTVYATVPVCSSVWANYLDCRDGGVVEYRLDDMARVAEHRFFSPDFYGRFELIECLDDELQVAVQAAVIRGQPVRMSVLAFPVAAPDTFNPIVAGANMGNTLAYDRAHDAMFYTSEFTHRVVRVDRRASRVEDIPSDDFARTWFHPINLRQFTGSSCLYTNSIHPGRNRIYLGEWLQGRYAYAIDLDTLRVVARYDVGGGGSLGITVDAPRDRLFVSSVWGVEVFDLATDGLVTRLRAGLGTRPPVIDAARNRIYLGSMVDGKIRVLDRDTLEVIGQIPIGIGGRFAHLSLDGKRLFASSTRAHYYWDADTLVPRR